jgi:hypothetical protein
MTRTSRAGRQEDRGPECSTPEPSEDENMAQALTFARAKPLKIEDLLISTGSTHAEPKVTDPYATKLVHW